MSNVLRGSVTNPEKVYGKSAYEIAVMHGFDGTEEEWIVHLETSQSESVKEASAKANKDIAEAREAMLSDIKLAANIVQTIGHSETAVMCQKAILKIQSHDIGSRTKDVEIQDEVVFVNGSTYNGNEFDSNNRCISSFLYGDENTIVECDDDFKIAVHKYTMDGTWVLDSGWRRGLRKIVLDGALYKILFARNNDGDVTPADVEGHLRIIRKAPKETMIPDFSRNYADGLTFEMGNWYHGELEIEDATNRCRAVYVRIPAYSKITATNSKFYLHILTNNGNVEPSVGTGWITEYFTEKEILCHIILAHTWDADITSIPKLQETLKIYHVGANYMSDSQKPIKVREVPFGIQGTIAQGIHWANDKRIHTDFFKVYAGMYMSVPNHKYSVQYYRSNTENSFYKEIYWMSGKYYLFEEDCYVRVVAGAYNDAVITAGNTTAEIGWLGKLAKQNLMPKREREFAIGAHRGWHGDGIPENSLVAFKAAAEKGFKYVETDIWWTSDNKPVANHDATYNGTYIANLTLEQAKERGLCPIIDFLVVCKLNNITPMLEFKTNLTLEQADIMYGMLKDMGMLNAIIVGFYPAAHHAMLNKHNFDVVLCNAYGTACTTELCEKALMEYGNNNNVYFGLFDTDFNESYYAVAQAAGVKLIYYSANTTETARNWVGHCDMFLTDYLELPIV